MSETNKVTDSESQQGSIKNVQLADDISQWQNFGSHGMIDDIVHNNEDMLPSTDSTVTVVEVLSQQGSIENVQLTDDLSQRQNVGSLGMVHRLSIPNGFVLTVCVPEELTITNLTIEIGERVHVDVHNNYQSSDDVHSGDDVHDTVQLPLTDSLVAEESSVFGSLQTLVQSVDVHNNDQSSDDVHSGDDVDSGNDVHSDDDVHGTGQLRLTDSMMAEETSVASELDTKSKKESYVGKLNVIEEGQSNFWTHILKSFFSLFHDMSHEAVLSRECWLPFGYHSITVDRQGGTYDLCSDGLTKLTVPRNAVRYETAEIRYAIIAMGPFQLPPNYQLGSFIVYVYYNPEEITTPVTLSLPTWYGGDVVPGETPPDGLSFAVAPHTLGLLDKQYTFQLVNGGTFASTSGALSIEGHSSLFITVFEEGASSTYFATKLEYEPLSDGWVDKITVYVALTYASGVWTEILEKHWGSSKVEHLATFKFKENSRLEAYIAKDSASVVALNGPRQMTEEGITFDYHNIRNATTLEKAVKGKRYPPKMMFSICSLRPEASPSPVANKQVHFGINGADVEICSSKIVYISQPVGPDPSSPNSQSPPLYKLLELFKKEFLQHGTVPAQKIARRLYDEQVIPQEIETEIMNAKCNYDAASRLYRHMTAQPDKESAKKLFDIMINTKAYPKMNALGRSMLDALQNNTGDEVTSIAKGESYKQHATVESGFGHSFVSSAVSVGKGPTKVEAIRQPSTAPSNDETVNEPKDLPFSVQECSGKGTSELIPGRWCFGLEQYSSSDHDVVLPSLLLVCEKRNRI